MKISKVEAFLMSCPLAKPLVMPFYGGERTILKRDAMLIRVTADNGLKGYAPGPAHERAEAEISSFIAPFLEGRDPRQWSSFDFQAELETTKTYRAVEIALIDLAARYEGAPLSELIGGRRRDRIKCYGSAGMYMSPQGYAEEAAAIAALGYPAYKMRPAAGPEKDLETLEKMRQAVGPEVGLMIDAHSWWRMGDRSYGLKTIQQLAQEMAPYKPYWLEEPLPPDDHQAYREFHETIPFPLASGEHEPDEESYNDLISKGAVDWVQMDVCCQGGFEWAGASSRPSRATACVSRFIAGARRWRCWPPPTWASATTPAWSSGWNAPATLTRAAPECTRFRPRMKSWPSRCQWSMAIWSCPKSRVWESP